MKWLNGRDSSSGTSQHLSPVVMSTVIQIPHPSLHLSSAFPPLFSVTLWQEMVFLSYLKLLSYFALSCFPNSMWCLPSHVDPHTVMGFSVCSSAPHFPAGQFLPSHTTYCPIWWATVLPESYRVGKDLNTHAPAPGFVGAVGSVRDQMPLSWEGPVSALNAGSTLTPPVTCRCGHAHLSSQRGACAPATAPQSPLKFTCESGKQRT